MIDRWEPEEVAIMTKKPKGEYVLFEDCQRLQAENERLRSELLKSKAKSKRLNDRIKRHNKKIKSIKRSIF